MNGWKESPDICETKTAQTVAQQLMGMADRLASRLAALEKRTVAKLEPISKPVQPMPLAEDCKPAEQWPPYFAQMRELLSQAEGYTQEIDRAIDRVAL